MGYPTKVQLIDRKKSQQWYINFPGGDRPGHGVQAGRGGRVDHPGQAASAAEAQRRSAFGGQG